MNITVLTQNDVTVHVEMHDEQATIKDLKAKIYSTKEITQVMRMSHDGNQLIDDHTLESYGIKGGVIQAKTDPEKEINLLLDIPIKGKISKRIKNTATVEELLEQVNVEHNMVKLSESLKLMFEGEDLQLNMPLHFYNIKDCSVLDLQRPSIGLLIEDNHGDVLYHRIERHKLVKDLKKELSEYDGQVPAPDIATFYLNATGPTNFSGSIKDLYKGAKRCNVKGMRLYYKNGKTDYQELHDDQELDFYKLRDHSMLYLIVYRWAKPFELQRQNPPYEDVVVYRWAKPFELQRQNPPYEDVVVYGVEPEQDTILSLKLRLQEQHGIPVSQKALCLSRKEEHGPSPIDARATFVYEYATPFCIL